LNSNTKEANDQIEARRTVLSEVICPSFQGEKLPAIEWDTFPMYEAITNYKMMGATHFQSLWVADPYWTTRTTPLFNINGRHPDGAAWPGSKLTFANFKGDGTSHTIMVTETVEPLLARWALGWQQTVVGLPTNLPGWSPIDAVTFLNNWDYGRYWHPTGFNGRFGEESRIPVDCPLFRTFLSHDYKVAWYLPDAALPNPRPQDPQQYGPTSEHPGITNHLFVDASVHNISTNIDVAAYMFMITREGGDPAPTTDEGSTAE
jgi:hypothetical protein